MQDSGSPPSPKGDQSGLLGSQPVACLPIKLEAFVLSLQVIDAGAKSAVHHGCVGPLLQPDYTGLDVNPAHLSNDILPRSGNLAPYATMPDNPRFGDSVGEIRSGRQGIYLHWTLPQVYRLAAEPSQSATDTFQDTAKAHGFQSLSPDKHPLDPSAIRDDRARLHRAIPDRWLIIRHIDPDSVKAPIDQGKLDEFQVFVLESNCARTISDLGEDVDIEVDVSPFIDMSQTPENQSNCYLGRRLNQGDVTEGAAKYVPLSAFSGANPLFLDFQPHNCNVLSLIDTLSYTDNGSTRSVMTARASYFVAGWFQDPSRDLFADDTTRHDILLQRLKMQLASSDQQSIKDWMAAVGGGTSVIHGALYNVEWDITGNTPAPNSPLNSMAQEMETTPLVSVGSTPLESLRAMLKRHAPGDSADIESIYNLDQFRLSEDEPVSAEYRQRDALQEAGFLQSVKTSTWRFTKPNPSEHPDQKPSLAFNSTQTSTIVSLRQLQCLRDSLQSSLAELQWELFAEWWKYMTDMRRCDPGSEAKLNLSLQTPVHDQLALGSILNTAKALNGVDAVIAGLAKNIPEAAKVPTDPFHRRKDPTVTISRLSAGWDADFTEPLTIRLGQQVINSLNGMVSPATNQNLNSAFGDAMDLISLSGRLSGSLTVLLQALIYEWVLLENDVGQGQPVGATGVPPYFHDKTPTATPSGTLGGRDFWNGTQPFSPLFVEWEAVYYHIEKDRWSSYCDGDRLQYDLNQFVGEGNAQNVAKLSGRELLLPQISADIVKKASITDSTDLRKVMSLPHLSFSLQGLREQLTTRLAGTAHLTPKVQVTGFKPTILHEAIQEPTFSSQIIDLMGNQNSPLPFGNNVDVLLREYSLASPLPAAPAFSPMKPVTHGQVLLTSIRIIDRFGQILSVEPIGQLDPLRLPMIRPGPKTFPIYPAVADQYCCKDLVDPHLNPTTVANTVILDKPDMCAFIQLPPSVNQSTRLNADFVVPNSNGPAPFRIFREQWENPIWGWIIVNYADFGLQFFLPSGKFYAEVRLQGREGVTSPIRWLPLEPPSHSARLHSLAKVGEDVSQLEELLSTFSSPDYTASFIKMIIDSQPFSNHPPATYGQHLAGMVGRPLALTNIGFSMELSEPPRTNQSSVNPMPPEAALTDYDFAIKIGEKIRVDDGLVGFFGPTASSDLSKGANTRPNLDVCYTYFSQNPSTVVAKGKCQIFAISDDNYPTVSPYHVDPLDLRDQQCSAIPLDDYPRLAQAYEDAQSRQLQIVSVIMDPFLPLHLDLGGVLPVKQIRLPSETVRDALDNMTFFFQAGPLLLSDDPLHPRSSKGPSGATPSKDTTAASVGIPVVAIGSWEWMQPFVQMSSGKDGQATGPKDRRTSFTSIPVTPVDLTYAAVAAPQTAVEGYLHLLEPLTSRVPAK